MMQGEVKNSKSSVPVKKRPDIFKKKKKKKDVDLRNIDLTIKRDGESTEVHKTAAEIAFEERQRQNRFARLSKKAEVSHREKVEKFNAQMSELTEFNDIPKVSWTK